jgi:hypothetical protein
MFCHLPHLLKKNPNPPQNMALARKAHSFLTGRPLSPPLSHINEAVSSNVPEKHFFLENIATTGNSIEKRTPKQGQPDWNRPCSGSSAPLKCVQYPRQRETS